MPNDLFNTPYSIAHKARKPDNPLKRSPVLPPSKGESTDPDFLLHHENRFDPNVITPEQLEQKPGFMKGKSEDISKA